MGFGDFATGIKQWSSTSSGSDDGVLKGWLSAPPIGNFNFYMLVECAISVPLKSVRAFQKVNQYERIREGGLNDYVTLKRAPIQEPHQLVVERYLMPSLIDPLANGAELSLPLILAIDHSSRTSESAASTDAARFYVFTGCTVMSKEYGELNAERSGLATETITIGYKMMYIVPSLWGMGGDPSKAFTENAKTGDDALASTINKELEAREKEKSDKAKKAKELEDWSSRRKKQEETGEIDPEFYGGKYKRDADGRIMKDDKGNPIIDWGTPKTVDEKKYFETDKDGKLKKDDEGNFIIKGSTALEKAQNKKAYAEAMAEAEASQKDIDARKQQYEAAQKQADAKKAEKKKTGEDPKKPEEKKTGEDPIVNR